MIFNNVVYGIKYVYIVHFKINETTYTALENMTWQEWINSEYNTAGYGIYITASGDTVIGNADDDMGVYNNLGYAKASDIIVAGYSYSYEKN